MPPLYPPSNLDANQVLQHAFDEANQTLRTTATATIIGGDLTVDTSHTEDSIRLGDGTNFLTSTQNMGKNGLDVNIINSSLEMDITHTNDSVRLGDGTNFLTSTINGSKVELDVNTSSNASTPTIYNVTATLANTEYSQVFPINTKKFLIKLRPSGTATNLQFSYTLGQSGTTYIKVPFGCFYQEDGLNTTSGITLYFQTDQPAQILEIIVWT